MTNYKTLYAIGSALLYACSTIECTPMPERADAPTNNIETRIEQKSEPKLEQKPKYTKEELEEFKKILGQTFQDSGSGPVTGER